jgi:hypothetical protein
MSKVYHVLNDYSLQELTSEELQQFERRQAGLGYHEGKVNGCLAICYRNYRGELVYVRVESWEDLNGYQLKGY